MGLKDLLRYKGVLGFMAVWMIFLGMVPSLPAMPMDSNMCFRDEGSQQEQVAAFLGDSRVMNHLRRIGIQPQLLKERLAQLDEAQIQYIAQKIETVNKGGDAGTVLFAVFVVLSLVLVIVLFINKYTVHIEPKNIK